MDNIACKTSEVIRMFILENFSHEFGNPLVKAQKDSIWQKIRETGTTLWLDTGDINEASKLWNAEFKALTTNNTLLNKEVQKGIYDDLVGRVAKVIKNINPGINKNTLILEIAFVLNAYHALRIVEQFDVNVSVELHTDLANNLEQTIIYGKRFFEICPERFYIKVPLTPSGFLAARKLSKAGIPLNFTLGFSARQNYLAALIANPRYVNVFMGRLNAFVINNNLGDGKNMGEKATLATQHELIELRKKKRSETLLIGASMRTGEQIETLAGLDVYTMPPKVAAQYRENPSKNISSQINKNLSVSFNHGITLNDFNGSTLWDVPQNFKNCVEDLLSKDIDNMTPENLQSHFEESGFKGLLPRWSEADCVIIKNDGKIPIYNTWKKKLVSGETGLDALMNISAFYSFVTDQEALDNRINSLIT